VIERLDAGEACPECVSGDAWTRYRPGGEKLSIDREAVRDAVARRAGLLRTPLLPRLGRRLPVFLAAGLGALGVATLPALFRARELGPLASVQAEIVGDARLTALLSAGAFVLGVAAMIGLKRTRLFRSWPLLSLGLAAVAAGIVGGIVGGVQWWTYARAFGWEHVEVPEGIEVVGADSDMLRAVARATAVVFAPDEEGDARGIAVGTGAIIHTEPGRAWIVTCSHVAMPYMAVAARRDVRKAQPVWIYLSDGRNAKGTVRWTAQPPLDVAVVSVEIDAPPPPVPVAPDVEGIDAGTGVLFVPNPMRRGWLVHKGEVLRRDPHITSAGRFSLFFTNLPVDHGDSGSGLYDWEGRLIGLNTWKRGLGEISEGISLPSESMRGILDRIERMELDELPGREEDR